MPWYVAASFTGYTFFIIWQATRSLELGRLGLGLVPFLLAKLAIMLVALSYWVPPVCVVLGQHLGGVAVFAATLITLQEAAWNFKFAILEPAHAHRNDNLAVSVTILATVVFPFVVLTFAAYVVLANECAI